VSLTEESASRLDSNRVEALIDDPQGVRTPVIYGNAPLALPDPSLCPPLAAQARDRTRSEPNIQIATSFGAILLTQRQISSCERTRRFSSAGTNCQDKPKDGELDHPIWCHCGLRSDTMRRQFP
jgi:hypothetical protein